MEFGLGTYTLGFLAGTASILSPCVLPLLPILIASALSRHRLGPVGLALGLGLSFAAVGIFVATLGAAIGLDSDTFRRGAAVLMVVCGVAMLSARLQAGFSRFSAGLSNAGHGMLARIGGNGFAGQCAIGLLLGVVWSPCVGPTLGAAATLAAQGRNLAHIAVLMAVFGLGAGLPLMILGEVSRASVQRMRGSLAFAGQAGKRVLGVLFVLLGVLVLSGWDHALEAAVLSVSPAWLTQFTTSL
jgi:cytochrome c-type biogenesis protein